MGQAGWSLRSKLGVPSHFLGFEPVALCAPQQQSGRASISMSNPDPALIEDYRQSHLGKGGQYDANLAAQPFDNYMAAWERRHLEEILWSIAPGGVGRALDFACGTGRITETVATFARESIGVDVSPTMLEIARSKCPATRFELVDLTSADPDVGQFDLITSFRFFGNAQDALRDAALDAIVRRLAANGRFILNSHRNPRALYARLQQLTGAADSGMDLHLPKLRALLGKHGLRIVLLRPIGAWMFRDRLMLDTPADSARARRFEALFGGSWLAPIAPDVIVVASHA